MKALRYFAIPAAILMIAIAFFVPAAQARSAEETQAILD